jgi:hypothetical protein
MKNTFDLTDRENERDVRAYIASLDDASYEIFLQTVAEQKAIREDLYNGAPAEEVGLLSINKPTGTVLQGDGTWPFTAQVDGDDIVVRKVYTTWFGGDNDPMDNGLTWSGVKTKGNPNCEGCALPLRDLTPRLKGSPIPVLPAKTMVRVYCWATGKSVTVPLIDIGPAKIASHPNEPHGLDLTQKSFKDLGLSLGRGLGLVDYRIINGAKVGHL